jgi:AcrR family transcriptional regulator
MEMIVAGAAPAVKRGYDSSGRRARAQEKHRRVLDCAQRLFLRDGYAATTIAAVADEAGVSTEAVYKRFGGKAGLVREIYQGGLAGQGLTPAPERSDAMSAEGVDARSVLLDWSRLSKEVAPLVSPVVLLARAAAATDVEAQILLDEMNTQRLLRMEDNARRLRRLPGLRPGLTTKHVRDVLFTYTAPELYETLVMNRGWSLDGYADFVFHGLTGQLLEAQ